MPCPFTSSLLAVRIMSIVFAVTGCYTMVLLCFLTSGPNNYFSSCTSKSHIYRHVEHFNISFYLFTLEQAMTPITWTYLLGYVGNETRLRKNAQLSGHPSFSAYVFKRWVVIHCIVMKCSGWVQFSLERVREGFGLPGVGQKGSTE